MALSTIGGFLQGNQPSGTGGLFRSIDKTLSTNTTISATNNSVAPGPIVVASGVTLTVATGGRLVVV